MSITFGTVCSGIGAPEVAWEPLGWRSQWAAEIDPFAAEVLRVRHPATPNLGTIVGLTPNDPIDVLIGGTPCQSFSVAGRRAGMDDPRGVLVWEFFRIARALQPRWLIWENVPGVLSSNKGRDFAAILGAFYDLGYRGGYRVLDAQYFGVPQRRRRIFLVGHLGNVARAAAVLFDRNSLRGNPAPRRKTRADLAGTVTSRIADHGGRSAGNNPGIQHCVIEPVANTLGAQHVRGTHEDNYVAHADSAKWSKGTSGPSGDECQNLIAIPETTHTLTGAGHDATEDGTGRGIPIVFQPGDPCHTLHAGAPAVAFSCKDDGGDLGETAPTLRACNHAESHANGGGQAAVVISGRTRGDDGRGYEREPNVDATKPDCVVTQSVVRRLTPRECERLQGFPDDYTLIDWGNRRRKDDDLAETLLYLLAAGFTEAEALALVHTPDANRYRSIGNSMAVPVIRWLGERIQFVESLGVINL